MACHTPYYVPNPNPYRDGNKEVPVPCGRCPDCQANRVAQWSFRLMEEDKVSVSSIFLTLTYNNEHITLSRNGFPTLVKQDFPLFMKKLRNYHFKAKWPHKIKYYMVGEYGSDTWRPHYHAIMFNANPDLIDSAWTDRDGKSIGHIHIGKVSGNSIFYTCGYLNKGKRVPRHARDDRIKEYSTSSKGLGLSYLTKEAVAYHKADLSRNYVTFLGGRQVALPRYYKDKLQFTDAELDFQRSLARNANMQGEILNEKRFRRIYGDDADYEKYKYEQKMGSYNKFLNNDKNRKL